MKCLFVLSVVKSFFLQIPCFVFKNGTKSVKMFFNCFMHNWNESRINKKNYEYMPGDGGFFREIYHKFKLKEN